MQHLQPNFTLHGGKYRIEQKPRYLKVYLTNSADCNVIKIILAFLKSVKSVNITNQKMGDLTVHPVLGKADTTMKGEVERTLLKYYSNTSDDNLTIKHTKRLISLLKKNSQEKISLESAIKSFNDLRFRHAFDDYRLCLEFYLREMFGNNKTLENQIQQLRETMKNNGFSVQLRNAIEKGIDCFCKFQNENVKHHNNISLIDTMTIFSWGNMILEQMMVLNKMSNLHIP
jgi:hypothetical protein